MYTGGFVKRLLSHELIEGTFFIFIGSFAGNILAFLLNLFLARSLTYEDYAVFATMLSLITLASIPSNSISTIIVKLSTKYFVENDKPRLKTLYLSVFKLILLICFLTVLLFTVFSFFLSDFLQLNNIFIVIVSGFAVASLYLNVLNMAFLQGMLKFKFISFTNFSSAVVKLMIGIFLVYLGFKASSGIWAIFFMTFASFLIAYIPIKSFLILKKTTEKIRLFSKDIRSFAVPAFLTILFMTSFTSIDVILVKHFFEPTLAGYYAGLSLLGKVIFYFTAPIPMVMFPLIVKRHTNKLKFNNLFYISMLLVITPSLFITLIYFLNPEIIIKIFLGGREYFYIAEYLGWFAIYLTIFSLINVFVNFFLSVNRISVFYFVLGGAILQIILIYLFHDNFYQVIGVSIFVALILLLILICLFVKNYVDLQKAKLRFLFGNSSLSN